MYYTLNFQGNADGTPKCIEKGLVCDSKKDCEDNADESMSCSRSSLSFPLIDYRDAMGTKFIIM
jgi:hypothetical protein